MNADPFDVAIIGAGPAGLAALRVAAQASARVVLIDDNSRLGGRSGGRVRTLRPPRRRKRGLQT